MLGLDAAGKTTILYKLHIGEILSTVPTIGELPRRQRQITCLLSFRRRSGRSFSTRRPLRALLCNSCRF